MTRTVLEAEAVEAPGQAASPRVGRLMGRLASWAREQGLETPVFGFARPVLCSGVERLRAELGARISYATKANAHPVVLGQLMTLVDDFNVTNVVHLDQVLALGVDPRRIAWLHPVLTPTLFEAVLARGVRRFVVDDQRGLDLLLASGADVAVTLRLLPPDSGESSRSVVRFGNTAEVVAKLGRAAAEAGLELEGISFFVGTHGAGIGDALPFRRGIEALARLRLELSDDGVSLPTVNIGGGFPGSRRRFYLRHPAFFRRIRDTLDTELGSGVGVICEPGRYLAEPALVLLTRVMADRVVGGRRLVYLDASAYGGLFESTFVDPGSPPTIWAAGGTGPLTPGELLGPVMDSFDVIEKGGRLPALREGELLVVPNVGAYSVGYTAECEGLRAPGVVELPDDLAAAVSEEWL